MITSPIFLVGVERSGTTLLRLMLDSHPKIAFHHEFKFSVDLLDENLAAWPDLKDYYEYLSTHRIFLHSNFDIDETLSYPELVNSFLLQKQRRSFEKPFVGATVHYQFHLLTQIWPEAKFIHLVRDGRDVAHSMVGMGWVGHVLMGVEQWVIGEKNWKRLSQQLPTERQLSVKYEDLILNTEQVLTQICQFIGVGFDKAMYNYANHSSYQLPESASVSQWGQTLSSCEIRLAESHAGQVLEEHGYPLSGLPPLTITSRLRYYIKMQAYWAKVCFRYRRYPFKLYLADILSRRIGTKCWRKQVKTRINECDEMFLK